MTLFLTITDSIIAYKFLLKKRKFCDIILMTTVLQGGMAFIQRGGDANETI